ncbi:ABC transporter substrate-binding protein [Cellulomonas phragmiteti]|uniref:ABC transporter substrate-binding protein n=1 Tax=Cellulomonas phragmiteti TaxID=478780 RepID=A0ABQ4DQT3_9CELL|nr:ABC transporter substrate-binding protein [Cellulomonas phragmiteti]GIG41716.1 ABC transporter substrate-binding protein [Cellulomonas phragmiteti]
MRARPAALAATTALLVPLSACASGADGAGGDAVASPGGAPDRPLVVAGSYEVHNVDPTTAGGLFTRLEVAETLVATDLDGTLVPGLATSWEASEDQLTWTFSLRETATFHDGTDVDADAVATALTRAHSTEGTPIATAPIADVGGEGDTVTVTLTEPFASLPAVAADTTGQVLAPASYGADGSVTQVIGSGPYEVVEVVAPSSVVVTAADTWDGDAPAITDVRYQSVGRSEARALMATSGDADLVLGMDPTALAGMATADGLTTLSVTLPRTVLLKLDGADPALGDPAVRTAISLALDREGMATAILKDPELAATQLFAPSLTEWHDEDLEPLTYDQDEARSLLAAAGWTPGSGGTLEKDGQRLTVTLRTFPDRAELPPLATAIQAALAAVGIEVEVLVGNSSEIPAAHAAGTLDLALYSRNVALVPDPLVTLLTDLAPEGADWGVMNWQDAGLTAALGTLADGATGDEAAAARAEVTSTLQEQLPLIPVAWYRQSAVVSDAVDGLELDPLERSWRLSAATWSAAAAG